MSISSNIDSLNFLPKQEPDDEDESPMNDDGEEFNTKGIRVLLVDADANSLRLMNDLLTVYSYQVTNYNKGEEAMSYMKRSKDEIDLVLWDYHMPDVTGLEALNTIGKDMDLPVVIISHNHEIEIVENSVTYGAYDFLVKPLSKEVVIVLWRHVFRKKISKSTVDSNSAEYDLEDVDQSNEEGSKNSVEQNTNSNRKGEMSSSKKTRMTWDNELHSKFVQAVQKLGNVDNAVPKQILKCMQEEMNVKGLTRNNVASHLQKYRQNAVEKTNAPQETQDDYRSAPNVALTPPKPVLHSSLDQFDARGLYSYNSTMQYPYAPSNLTMNNVNNTIFLNNPTNPLPKQPAYIDPYYFRPQLQQEYPRQQQQQDYYYSSLQLPSVMTKQDPEVVPTLDIQLPSVMTKQDPAVVPTLDIQDELIYDDTLPCEPDFFEKDLSKYNGF